MVLMECNTSSCTDIRPAFSFIAEIVLLSRLFFRTISDSDHQKYLLELMNGNSSDYFGDLLVSVFTQMEHNNKMLNSLDVQK